MWIETWHERTETWYYTCLQQLPWLLLHVVNVIKGNKAKEKNVLETMYSVYDTDTCVVLLTTSPNL